ncbi:replication initiator protein [Chicken microvirus mg6_218]|nr:replication initiator protein [Chicken microvirus mg6_218]
MCLYPKYLRNGRFIGWLEHPLDSDVPVPCGKCIECLSQKGSEWSYRVMREFDYYGRIGCVMSLTYDNAHLPVDGSVNRRDLQLFLKRLRKHIAPVKLRYFGCAEYGILNGRPHYHLVVIGWQPDDLVFVRRSKKNTMLYRSKTVEKIWSQGICAVAAVTADSVKYSAKYMQKIYFDETSDRTPPFLTMSTHPGFGAFEALDRVKSDSIYVNGVRKKVPRYYLKVAEREGVDLSELKEKRITTAKIMSEVVSDSVKVRRKKFEDKIRRDVSSKKYIDKFCGICYDD